MTFSEYARASDRVWNDLERRMITAVEKTSNRDLIIVMLNNRPNNVCKYSRVRHLYRRWEHAYGYCSPNQIG